ncbi:MAG TPA: hypothetical protein VEA80_16180 [Vitreimonas sp.]|uniref:hypothetical protein n=1 Tax=Vitreimonas sp. TaxID=3069702 RepID=UPI002D3FAC0D|nr:hypothetical protein [Vitreimonas sp.]HYD89015.1 hypothetical protein [Vitreimonas sp.]
MTAILPASQNKRRALLRNLMIVIGLGMAACAVIARMTDIDTHWPMLALLVAFCALAVAQFNTLDEVAKQAQYIAWYWGSMLGLAAILLIQLPIAFAGQRPGFMQEALMRWVDPDPMTSFLTGMMTTPLLMVIGFTLWWAAYWLRRR